MFAKKTFIDQPIFLRVHLQTKVGSRVAANFNETGVGESRKISKLILTSNFESSQVRCRSGRYMNGSPLGRTMIYLRMAPVA